VSGAVFEKFQPWRGAVGGIEVGLLGRRKGRGLCIVNSGCGLQGGGVSSRRNESVVSNASGESGQRDWVELRVGGGVGCEVVNDRGLDQALVVGGKESEV
jgi:hypothetical protein